MNSVDFEMKDTFGDRLAVHNGFGGYVYIDLHDGADKAEASLTPKKARRLAKALKKAAKAAKETA